MNIYGASDLFMMNKHWNGQGKDAFSFVKQQYGYGFYVENTQEFQDFKIAYDKIFSETDKTINESDVVYFFKESKYPRFKFSANCKNNKTIKIENADIIVTPNIINFGNIPQYKYQQKTNHTYQIIIDTITNNKYLINSGYKPYYEEIHRMYNKNTEFDSIIALMQDKFLIQGNNYNVITVEKLNVSYSKVVDANNFFNTVAKYIDKCISEETLEKYVTRDSMELDDDMYISLDTMLKSKDANTVELGMKMLNNFNLEKASFRFGMLIRKNMDTIANNKALQSAGFKNVLSQLNIDMMQVRGSDLLAYLNNLYKSSTDSDNKNLIREACKDELLKRTTDSYNMHKNYCRDINIDMNLEVI